MNASGEVGRAKPTAPAPSFRRATPADIDAIVALAQSSYRGEASRGGWTTEADFLDGQRIDPAGVSAMLQGRQCILLAHVQDELAGCCHLAEEGEACWFGLFAVSPWRQGQGIGDALLARAETEAIHAFGTSRLMMKVIWLRDSLIAWYERRGYTRTGGQAPFPYGDARFGVPRRDDLYFVVLQKPLR